MPRLLSVVAAALRCVAVVIGSSLLAPVGANAVRAAQMPPPPSIAAPSGTSFYGLTPQFAVSPDGRDVVVVATSPGTAPSLWVQPISAGAPRALAGTSGASYPFWSPNSRQVAFFSEGKLKRVDTAGGSPTVVCDAPTGRGGTWNGNGLIVFASGIGDPLRKVSDTGGAVTPATSLDAPRENSHRWPQFLPDGEHVLFWAGAGTAAPALKIASLTTGETVTVGPSSSNGAYADGFLFHATGTTLVALPFDPVERRPTGAPVSVVSPVSGDAGSFVASFSVSATGTLLYTQGTARPLVLTWFDRSGRSLGSIGAPGQYTNVNASRDGRRLAVSLTAGTPANRDVWIIEVPDGTAARLTTDPAVDATPVWSPDGASLIFSSQRSGPYQMYRRAASSAGPDELLLPSNTATIATDWSSDGRFVAYTRTSPSTGLDIWTLPLDGTRTPSVLVETPAADDNAVFKPDGGAIAYQSGVSGRDEVYVRPFPGAGEPVRVSTAGGTQPRWRGDGQELFYLAPDGSIVAVALSDAGRGWSFSAPRTIVPATMSLVIRQAYTTTFDGQRLLTPVVDQTNPSTITIAPGWTATGRK